MAPAWILHVHIASRELRLCRVVAQSVPDISANTLVVRSSNGEVDTVVNPSAGVANRNVIGNSNEVNSAGAMYCMLPGVMRSMMSLSERLGEKDIVSKQPFVEEGATH